MAAASYYAGSSKSLTAGAAILGGAWVTTHKEELGALQFLVIEVPSILGGYILGQTFGSKSRRKK